MNVVGSPTVAPSVRRVMMRDDLLTLAGPVHSAVGELKRDRSGRAPEYRDESALFSAALGMHARTADGSGNDPTIAVRSRVKVMNIALFARLVNVDLQWPSGVDGSSRFGLEVLHALDAMRETRAGEDMDGDLFTGVTTRLHAIRELRCSGDLATAIDAADLDDREFAGTGADFLRAHYQFELTAALLADGRTQEARQALQRSQFWEATADYRYPSRHRFEYALALAHWADGDFNAAAAGLKHAQRILRRARGSQHVDEIADLTIALARADLLLAAEPGSHTATNEIAGYLAEALATTGRIRGRWGVVSRSRNPLSMGFRRIYGDIARIAAALPGRQGAELGFAAALTAKQTGFASVIRRERTIVHGRQLKRLIDAVVRYENPDQPTLGDDRTRNPARHLDGLRLQILQSVSPMLANLVLPESPNVARVIDAVGARYALDYAGLPDTVTGETTWYRTLIEPTGTLLFEQLSIGRALAEFFASVDDPTSEMSKFFIHRRPDWHALGTDLFPERLVAALTAVDQNHPVDLVISPHGALSLMPWAAVKVDHGVRLFERSVVAQCPVLSCLSGPVAGPVAGPALVHLVTGENCDVRGVGIESERTEWRIAAEDASRDRPVRCELDSSAPPVVLAGHFAKELSNGTWGFAHIASHGSGTGLGQALDLPGSRVSAGMALTLEWPAAVLMASCHVGRLMNIEDAEPINFVTALLAGGSQCVVACTDQVDDHVVGELAASIVAEVRRGEVRLDSALRSALLRHALLPNLNYREHRWSLVNAYTR